MSQFATFTTLSSGPAATHVAIKRTACWLNHEQSTPLGAMDNPLGDLVSSWAYMVMASLAWTLKAWAGLMLPVSPGGRKARHEQQKQTVLKMEFKRFVNSFLRLPCQIVRTGRRLVYRLLSWNP